MSTQEKMLALLAVETQATLLCSEQLSSLHQLLLADVADRTDDAYTLEILTRGAEAESSYYEIRKRLLELSGRAVSND